MAEEHITRGQIIRVVQKIHLRHPRGLTKEWLYSMLKPVVDALEADLKETGQLPTDPTDTPEKGNQTDLGDTPKKPVEEKGNKTKQGNKPKEKKK